MANLQWVRVRKPTTAHWRPPAPEYDLGTVRRALRAAVDVGRYDIAQQIAEEAKSDVCIVCGDTLATQSVRYEAPDGTKTTMQLCDDCGTGW